MTSCTPNTLSCGGSGGCMGSVTQLGFNYLQLFGSVKEEDWPYVSGTTGQSHKYHGDCKCIKCRMCILQGRGGGVAKVVIKEVDGSKVLQIVLYIF